MSCPHSNCARPSAGSASWSVRWVERRWSHKILQAAQEEVKKKTELVRRVQIMTSHPLKTIGSVLGVSRATAYRQTKAREPFYARSEDDLVLERIRAVTKKRATYGHRRVTARVNRLFGVRYNVKRIRRVMRMHDLQIPTKSRRRAGRAHTGTIATEQSNVRWSSDAFEIAGWNGEIVQIGFALDCCDREALAFVAQPRDLCAADIHCLMGRAVDHRFGAEQTSASVQWLSDNPSATEPKAKNGSIDTALETVIHAERLGLEGVTTPVRSPESNGMIRSSAE